MQEISPQCQFRFASAIPVRKKPSDTFADAERGQVNLRSRSSGVSDAMKASMLGMDGLPVGAQGGQIHLHRMAPIAPCATRRQVAEARLAGPLAREERRAAPGDAVDEHILARDDVRVLRADG